MPSPQKPEIVLIEDDETDALLFMRYAKRNGIAERVTLFDTAESALSFLQARGSFASTAQVVVVTDINLPGLSGLELIEEIRRDQRIKNTVVFVISTSDLESDRSRAYENKIAGYILKDTNGASIAATTEMLKSYHEAVRI